MRIIRRLHDERDWCYIVHCDSYGDTKAPDNIVSNLYDSGSTFFVQKLNIPNWCIFYLFLSDNVSTLVKILTPRGLAFNPTGSIVYLTTPYQILSMPFSASGVNTSPTVLAGGGAGGGATGFADGQGILALFNWPTSMAIHPLGNI